MKQIDNPVVQRFSRGYVQIPRQVQLVSMDSLQRLRDIHAVSEEMHKRLSAYALLDECIMVHVIDAATIPTLPLPAVFEGRAIIVQDTKHRKMLLPSSVTSKVN